MIKLTKENYYDHSTDFDYMSFSLFKDFSQCEAATLAKIKDDWKPKSSPEALLMGNYVHSYFESQEAHAAFLKKEGKKLISTRGKSAGQLKAPYKLADQMINVLEEDDQFEFFYGPGDKEVIVTGELFGHPWKGKIDSLNLKDGFFCDLKTVDDFHKKHWDEETRSWVSFIEDRGYFMQMAIYKELIKQTFGKECFPLMFAVSKQTPPDKTALDFTGIDDGYHMEDELEKIKIHQDHYWAVVTGEEAPTACGRCEYCRSQKTLDGFEHASELAVY